MAGQGILLSSFQEGEYRLGITVTDLLSRKVVSARRHVYGCRLVAERRSHGTQNSRALGGGWVRSAHRPRDPGPRSRSSPSPAWCRPVRTVSHAMSTIASAGVSGIVSDEHGSPLAGAMVSVLGATTAMTLTDASGRFSLQALPPGDYTVRAHLPGFSRVAARERPPRGRAHRYVPPAACTTSKSRSRQPASSDVARGPADRRRGLQPARRRVRVRRPSRATTIIPIPTPRGGCAISRAAS